MSDAMARYGGPQWKILSVTAGSGQDAMGSYGRGYNVAFQLASGHSGTVFVPYNNFDRDSVKAAIMAAAANLNEVVNLTSES